MGTITHEFQSWGEFLSYCEEPATRRAAAELEGLRAKHESDYSGPWLGGLQNRGSYAAALTIARSGWAAGMAHVNTLAAPMVNALAPLVSQDGGWAWDVTGAAYDVGEYLSGTPECWLTANAPAVRPTITIQSLAAIYAEVDGDAINRRGGAAVALALALERAGYAVRIEVVHGCGYRGTPGQELWCRTVLTDDNGGPIDVDRVIFALIHPAAHRVLRHVVARRLGNVKPSYFEGYPAVRSTCPWPASITLPSMMDPAVQWSSRESVNRWLQTTLDKITKGDN